MELMTDAMIEKIEINSLTELKKEFDLSIPFTSLSEEINKRLRKLQPKIKMAGFRPGKVPFAMVQSEHGEQIFFEVANDRMIEAIGQIIEKKQLNVAGTPEVKPEILKYGEDILCKVTFEIFPEVEIADISQLKLEQKRTELKSSDMDEFLLFLRRKEAKDFNEPSHDQGAAEGDQVEVSCEMKIVGEDKPINQINDKFILDKWSNLPEPIYQALIGMKSGENKEVEEKLPEDYFVSDFVGKTMHYAITLKALKIPVLPELNQDFFSTLGIKDADETGFRDKLKQQMESGLKEKLETQNKALVFNSLLAAHKFSVPDVLIRDEAEHDREHYVRDMNQYFKESKNKFKKDMIPLNAFLNKAEEKVKLSFIMQQLAKTYDIKLDQQKLDAYLEEKAASYEQPQEFIDMYKQNKKAYENLSALVLENQIIEKIIEKADVNFQEVSYFDLMKTIRK